MNYAEAIEVVRTGRLVTPNPEGSEEFSMVVVNGDHETLARPTEQGLMFPSAKDQLSTDWMVFSYEIPAKSERIREDHGYGHAFDAAFNGFAIRLPNWSDDVIVKAQFPDEHSKMTHPYLYVESRFGRVPWMPTQVEMFATTWQIIVEEKEKKKAPDYVIEVGFDKEDLGASTVPHFAVKIAEFAKSLVDEAKDLANEVRK